MSERVKNSEPITDAEGEETSRAYLKKYVVFNVEQFPSAPFLEDVAKRGLPTTIIDIKPGDQDPLFEVVT